MGRSLTFALVAFVCLAAIGPALTRAAAGNAADPEPADENVQTYRHVVDKADEQLDAAMQKGFKAYSQDLRDARRAAAKAGNTDEADRLKAELDRVDLAAAAAMRAPFDIADAPPNSKAAVAARRRLDKVEGDALNAAYHVISTARTACVNALTKEAKRILSQPAKTEAQLDRNQAASKAMSDQATALAADDTDLPLLPPAPAAAGPKPFSFDGQWTAPRGLVTVKGATLSAPHGVTGKVVVRGDRITIYWSDTGYGNLFIDPANPDTITGAGKSGGKITWTRNP